MLIEERQIYPLLSDKARRNLTGCFTGTSLSEQPQPARESERTNGLIGIGERDRHPHGAY